MKGKRKCSVRLQEEGKHIVCKIRRAIRMKTDEGDNKRCNTMAVRSPSKLFEDHDGLGCHTGGEGGCQVWELVTLVASSFISNHPLAVPHIRQGVAVSKGSMSTIHQMVSNGRSPDGKIG
ncbi:hypothetical protein E2C01_044798 [Portunus trituberculatus]|uniref:Uncharacterized protein n=1 Tax=Portunus trituberculatus TaxID=210409 RepID=A0A5B7G150_PORTR|nr:hypothetical protein [Portunus trituberculatus]